MYYILHTLYYWSVGFKNESNAIWVTVLNLFFQPCSQINPAYLLNTKLKLN
jgi:hypothetical protein